MSTLAEYRALERLLDAHRSRLEAMKRDPRLQRDYEFERRLQALLAEYRFGLPNVLAILDREHAIHRLQQRQLRPQAQAQRKVRPLKFYRNPYTGEVVEAKTSTHKALQMWVEMFGREEVESWAARWF